ncbi:MAG TPA: adenosylcobinamide amidohydrolase, partial [Clostridia bacterium]|nr:adenosylcobinamide amidohydrolase [Clostridia bacterium]
SFRDLRVLAVATGGVDHNGGRPGDPAAYYEENGRFFLFPGTINILLAINACLPPAALVKAVITATEAKSGALLELLVPSCYSEELATGSGTDGIIVASDPAAPLVLTDAGHHSKLGELIGLTVREAVKKALALETGCTPERQRDVLVRLKRFGLDEEALWRRFCEQYPGVTGREGYLAALRELAGRPDLVAQVSCLLHLADQVRWGLLRATEAWQISQSLLPGAGLEARPPAADTTAPQRAFPDLVAGRLNHLVWKHVAGSGPGAGK